MTPLVDRALVRHWRRMARRIRPTTGHRLIPWHSRPVMIDQHLWRVLAVVALALMAWSSAAAALGLLAWWQFLGAMGRAAELQSGLGDRAALMALRLLPIPDARIAWALTTPGRRAALVAGGETLLVGAVAVLASGAPGWTWAGLPFAATASAGLQMALSARLVHWRPYAPWGLLHSAGVGLALGATLLEAKLNKGPPDLMGAIGLMATPVGWGLQILPRGTGAGPDAFRILLGTAAGVAGLVLARPATIALVRSFRMGEDPAEPDRDPAPSAATSDRRADQDATPAAAAAADTDALVAWKTATLMPPARSLAGGPLGGAVARLPRPVRWMAAILAPDPPVWWRRRRTLLLVAVAVAMVLGILGTIPDHLAGTAACIAIIALLPLHGGAWEGIDRRALSQWPLGVGAFLAAVMAVNAIRVVTRLPLFAALLLMATVSFPALLPHLPAVAAAVLTASVAAVPFGAAVLLGRQTSLALGMLTWRRLPLAMALVLPTAGGIVALAMMASAWHPLPALIGAAVAIGCAGAVLGTIVLAIRRGWCDLR